MSRYFLIVGRRMVYDTPELLNAAINHRFSPGQEEEFCIIKGEELTVDTVQEMITQQVPVRYLKVKE
jgi:hypothetical protein